MTTDILAVTTALLAPLTTEQVAAHYDALPHAVSGPAYTAHFTVGMALAERYRAEAKELDDASILEMLEPIADRRQGPRSVATLRGVLVRALVERHEEARIADHFWLTGPDVPASQDAGPGPRVCAAVRVKLAP